MSGNNSGAQKSARARLEELRQQILDVEEAAQMEEEALRAQEAEWKHLVDLEKVRQVEIRIQQAEEKRCQEIVKEMLIPTPTAEIKYWNANMYYILRTRSATPFSLSHLSRTEGLKGYEPWLCIKEPEPLDGLDHRDLLRAL
ncbi:hypothetical protein BDR03DRAFT_1017208 [Suillus americanus]|nr:hypothetical protein BDR03DRAFT_1017208 [Suillus americanus]